MSEHILVQFDRLMDHLNGVDNGMAAEFREALESVSDAAEFLDCLESAGVDNWVGYEDAQEEYRENHRE